MEIFDFTGDLREKRGTQGLPPEMEALVRAAVSYSVHSAKVRNFKQILLNRQDLKVIVPALVGAGQPECPANLISFWNVAAIEFIVRGRDSVYIHDVFNAEMTRADYASAALHERFANRIFAMLSGSFLKYETMASVAPVKSPVRSMYATDL